MCKYQCKNSQPRVIFRSFCLGDVILFVKRGMYFFLFLTKFGAISIHVNLVIAKFTVQMMPAILDVFVIVC